MEEDLFGKVTKLREHRWTIMRSVGMFSRPLAVRAWLLGAQQNKVLSKRLPAGRSCNSAICRYNKGGTAMDPCDFSTGPAAQAVQLTSIRVKACACEVRR